VNTVVLILDPAREVPEQLADGRKDGVIVGAARWPNPPKGRPS
jgi:hypothetical protein